MSQIQTLILQVVGVCLEFENVHAGLMHFQHFSVGRPHSLESFLAQGNRKVKEIKGDGNCFFRALLFILFNNEDEDYAIRSL